MRLCWQQIPSTVISDILCQNDLEGVVLDTEHSAFNLETLYSCIQVIALNQKKCFVRLTEVNKTTIRMCLDAGCHGIIFSTVETILFFFVVSCGKKGDPKYVEPNPYLDLPPHIYSAT